MSSNKLSDNDGLADIDDMDLVKPGAGLYEGEFWAVKRHELIADVAEGLIKTTTAQKIKQLMEPLTNQGFLTSLPDLAAWADLTKDRGPKENDDTFTKEFLTEPLNAKRGIWHFVDLPLGAQEYSRELYPTLTNDEDVVQILSTAIKVLCSKSSRFSAIIATRLVVHLVGDVHQPLHVGCGYLDLTSEPTIITDPAVVLEKGLESDHGGNKIILPEGAGKLHSYWDGKLGGDDPDINPEADPAITQQLKKAFSAKLRRMVDQDPQPDPQSAAEADPTLPEDWVKDWADQSLAAAREAYQTIVITGPNATNFNVKWEGKTAYDSRCQPIAIDRMKAAARNLALLLDAIFADPA